MGFNRIEFIREISIMSMIRHKNLLFCFGACTVQPDRLLIITEWVPNDTLRNLLEDKNISLTWPMRLTLAAQVAKGLGFIHSMHLIHCDIKSHNIMVIHASNRLLVK